MIKNNIDIDSFQYNSKENLKSKQSISKYQSPVKNVSYGNNLNSISVYSSNEKNSDPLTYNNNHISNLQNENSLDLSKRNYSNSNKIIDKTGKSNLIKN